MAINFCNYFFNTIIIYGDFGLINRKISNIKFQTLLSVFPVQLWFLVH